MSEAVYEQVEDAIARKLYLGGRYTTTLGGMSFEYPVGIRLGNIVLRDGDCGLAKAERVITTEEWERCARHGLFKKVGFWDFCPAEDPAAEEIAYCHRNPQGAGRELRRLRASAPARR